MKLTIKMDNIFKKYQDVPSLELHYCLHVPMSKTQLTLFCKNTFPFLLDYPLPLSNLILEYYLNVMSQQFRQDILIMIDNLTSSVFRDFPIPKTYAKRSIWESTKILYEYAKTRISTTSLNDLWITPDKYLLVRKHKYRIHNTQTKHPINLFFQQTLPDICDIIYQLLDEEEVLTPELQPRSTDMNKTLRCIQDLQKRYLYLLAYFIYVIGNRDEKK